MKDLKFTQEVKDKWLEALKSGDYTQGYVTLKDTSDKNNIKHCCIGVLGEIHPELTIVNRTDENCPYNFLTETIGKGATEELWKTNDSGKPERFTRPEDYKDDYSNVIPLIEALPVQQ